MAVINLTEPTELTGYEIASNIARKLNFVLIDHYFIKNKFYKRKSIIDQHIVDLLSSGKSTPENIKKLILNQALKSNIVVFNLGGEILFHNIPGTLNVKISLKSTIKSFPKKVREKNSNFKKFVKVAYGLNRIDSSYYDLQIKLDDDLDTDFASGLILKAVDMKTITAKAGITWKEVNKLKRSKYHSNLHKPVAVDSSDPIIPDFAHPSEREFAKLLDYYLIRWKYEPRSFTLKKDESGRIKEEFTPDFYLTDLDLYIELTTMKQKLVTRKNRKVRRLKQLYPEVNIKIFYGKDYDKLLRKFGIK